MNPVTAAYAPIYRHVVFPVYEGVVRCRPTHRYHREINQNPYLTLEQLAERQSHLLRRLVVHCEQTVPHYKDLFRSMHIDAAQVSDVRQLRDRGVSTSKALVRAVGDEILSTAFAKASLPNSATSGSSGTPVLFFTDYDNWCLRTATKYRSEGWFGKRLGSPCTLIWGHKPGMGTRAWLRYHAFWALQNYQFLSAFDIGEDRLIRYARSMRRWGSQFLESYVTVAYLMARALDTHRIAPPPLRGIVVGGERLHDFQRAEIERVFGCPVYNRYGSTEFSNVATECAQRQGLHVNADRLWVEVVDEDDRPVTDEVGEIVITDLRNYAMPLLRYRTGDRAVLTMDACACGRRFPMLREVVGRTSEVLRVRDGRQVHDMYFLWRLSRAPGVLRFQVVQKSLDLLWVNIESDGKAPRTATVEFVADALDELSACGIKAEVRFVDRVPPTPAGKMMFFVSELGDAARNPQASTGAPLGAVVAPGAAGPASSGLS